MKSLAECKEYLRRKHLSYLKNRTDKIMNGRDELFNQLTGLDDALKFIYGDEYEEVRLSWFEENIYEFHKEE